MTCTCPTCGTLFQEDRVFVTPSSIVYKGKEYKVPRATARQMKRLLANGRLTKEQCKNEGMVWNSSWKLRSIIQDAGLPYELKNIHGEGYELRRKDGKNNPPQYP